MERDIEFHQAQDVAVANCLAHQPAQLPHVADIFRGKALAGGTSGAAFEKAAYLAYLGGGLGRHPRHHRPTPRLRVDQPLVLELMQRAPQRRPAYLQLVRHLDLDDALARREVPVDDRPPQVRYHGVRQRLMPDRLDRRFDDILWLAYL